MAKEQTKPKGKIGRSDRYPSDYGVRDHDQDKHADENGSWVPGDRGQGAKVKARVTGEAGGRELVPRGHRVKSGGLTMRGAEVFGVGLAALDRAGAPDPAPPQPPDLPPTPVPQPGIPPEPDLPPGTPPPKPIT